MRACIVMVRWLCGCAHCGRTLAERWLDGLGPSGRRSCISLLQEQSPYSACAVRARRMDLET